MEAHRLTSPAEMAPGPVGGSFAWTAAEVLARDDWALQLTEPEIALVETAARATHARGLSIHEIRQDDFPLGPLALRLGALRAQIRNGLGLGYIRGLPVQRYDAETRMRIYWGLSRHIGDPLPQNRNGHLIGHVIDIGTSVEDANKRITQTTAELCFHTDSCDVVGLFCVHPAKAHGQSALVSGVAVHDELMRRRPDLLPELYQPIYMDRRGEVPPGKQPWFGMPLFTWHAGLLSGYAPVRQYMDSLARFPDAPRMSAAQAEAFELFTAICAEDTFQLSLPFAPGDIQYLHNHVVFHSRTAYEDWPERERKRHLMRIWLSLPDGRELHPAFAEKWIEITPGQRRGGVRTDAPPAIPLDPFTEAYA